MLLWTYFRQTPWLDSQHLFATKIRLTVDWEVALLEVPWPQKFKKITNSSFTISRFDNTNRPLRPEHIQTTPSGFYSTVDTLWWQNCWKILWTRRTGQHSSLKEGGPIERETQTVVQKFCTRGPFLDFAQVWWSVKYFGSADATSGTVDSERQKGFAALGIFLVDLQGGRHKIFINCFGTKRNFGWLSNRTTESHLSSTKRSIYCSNLLQTFRQDAMEAIEEEQTSITISFRDEKRQLILFASIDGTNVTLSFRRRKKNIRIR